MIATDSTVSKQTLIALRDTCLADASKHMAELLLLQAGMHGDLERSLSFACQLQRSLAAAWAYDVLVQES